MTQDQRNNLVPVDSPESDIVTIGACQINRGSSGFFVRVKVVEGDRVATADVRLGGLIRRVCELAIQHNDHITQETINQLRELWDNTKN